MLFVRQRRWEFTAGWEGAGYMGPRVEKLGTPYLASIQSLKFLHPKDILPQSWMVSIAEVVWSLTAPYTYYLGSSSSILPPPPQFHILLMDPNNTDILRNPRKLLPNLRTE